MMFATSRDARLADSWPLMSSSRRSSPASAWLRASRRADLERRGGLVGEDQEEPLVVLVELVRPSFESVITPTTWAVVAHRDDEHRLVDIVGSGDGLATRIGVRIIDEERRRRAGRPSR